MKYSNLIFSTILLLFVGTLKSQSIFSSIFQTGNDFEIKLTQPLYVFNITSLDNIYDDYDLNGTSVLNSCIFNSNYFSLNLTNLKDVEYRFEDRYAPGIYHLFSICSKLSHYDSQSVVTNFKMFLLETGNLNKENFELGKFGFDDFALKLTYSSNNQYCRYSTRNYYFQCDENQEFNFIAPYVSYTDCNVDVYIKTKLVCPYKNTKKTPIKYSLVQPNILRFTLDEISSNIFLINNNNTQVLPIKPFIISCENNGDIITNRPIKYNIIQFHYIGNKHQGSYFNIYDDNNLLIDCTNCDGANLIGLTSNSKKYRETPVNLYIPEVRLSGSGPIYFEAPIYPYQRSGVLSLPTSFVLFDNEIFQFDGSSIVSISGNFIPKVYDNQPYIIGKLEFLNGTIYNLDYNTLDNYAKTNGNFNIPSGYDITITSEQDQLLFTCSNCLGGSININEPQSNQDSHFSQIGTIVKQFNTKTIFNKYNAFTFTKDSKTIVLQPPLPTNIITNGSLAQFKAFSDNTIIVSGDFLMDKYNGLNYIDFQFQFNNGTIYSAKNKLLSKSAQNYKYQINAPFGYGSGNFSTFVPFGNSNKTIAINSIPFSYPTKPIITSISRIKGRELTINGEGFFDVIVVGSFKRNTKNKDTGLFSDNLICDYPKYYHDTNYINCDFGRYLNIDYSQDDTVTIQIRNTEQSVTKFEPLYTQTFFSGSKFGSKMSNNDISLPAKTWLLSS
ncbi:hypothetical protein ACTFIW_007545 [Dictyostelium discoideum]